MKQQLTACATRVSSVRQQKLQFRFGHRQDGTLPVESRRALALYRAADLAEDTTAVRDLVAYAGCELQQQLEGVVISENECHRLAHALRRDGYPLTDDGISLFKMERGYSAVVRIGPNMVDAYARHARGLESRLDIAPHAFRQLNIEVRRAARILVTVGHDVDRLVAVLEALGISSPAVEGIVPVTRRAAGRLVEWAHRYGMSLTNRGMMQIGRAAGSAAKRIDGSIAGFVADLLTAPGEPEHDYTRLHKGNHTLNRRTYAMLRQTQTLLTSCELRLFEASYAVDVGRGAHPHKGGGVVDLEVKPAGADSAAQAVGALRQVGFAAWFRPRQDKPHIHAVAIGDRELSAAASWQVKSYFMGRDGRSRSEPDPHARLAVQLPLWVRKYGVRYQ